MVVDVAAGQQLTCWSGRVGAHLPSCVMFDRQSAVDQLHFKRQSKIFQIYQYINTSLQVALHLIVTGDLEQGCQTLGPRA